MNAQKEEYVRVSNLIDLPLFYSSWWLDMVCTQGEWNGIVSYDDRNNIRGIFTYFLKRTMLGNIIKMPPFTPQMGPLLIQNNTLSLSENSPELYKAHDDFLKRLPKAIFFRQRTHPSVINWMPYYWAGFRQTTRFTYHISLNADYDLIFNKFKNNIKSDIRKAQRNLNILEAGNTDILYQLIQRSFTKKVRNSYSKTILNAVFAECSKRKCIKILYAIDEIKNIHSAILIVWDKFAAYYLIGVSDPAFRGSGAGSLLLWNAMQIPDIKGKLFDFEGSMIQPVEKYFRAFGGRLIRYNEIIKNPIINKIKYLL